MTAYWRNLILWIFIGELFVQMVSPQRHKDSEQTRCPSFVASPNCECQVVANGLDFQCQEETKLKDFKIIISASRFPIENIQVISLDLNTTCLCEKIFLNGSTSELRIMSSKITEIDDDAFNAPAMRLESLFIQNSMLKVLPRALGKVPSLRNLDLEYNEIEEIIPYTFFGPLKLSFISLKNNNLTQLSENAFLGLENTLRELNLMNNQLIKFPMSAVKILKKLQKLNLAGNSITDIYSETFTRLESLKLVDLSNNQFTKLSHDAFLSTPNINRLTLALNSIREIEVGAFDSLHVLEALDLSFNSLTEIPKDLFAHTSRITRIDLSNNRLKRVNHVFVNLYALEEVFLNNNLLLNINNEMFSNTPNLKVIHLENNVLADISDDAFQLLKRLTEIRLSHNFLHEIRPSHFRYNVALVSLSLDNNHIVNVNSTSFQALTRLKELRMQNNIIRQIDRDIFNKLSQLTELHLQGNKISQIEPDAFSSLANLQHLDLTGNRVVKLEDIMMRYPSALRTLYLDRNKLTTFHQETFSGQTTAEILSMTFNRLEIIPANAFVELINLFRLNLSNNRLSKIEDNALVGLHQLRFLDISFNRLSVLTSLSLRGLQQAEVVNLSHNRLTTIHSEAFTGFHHLQSLDLSFNRIKVLESGAFRGCLTLKTLKLNKAGIRTIQQGALNDFKSLTHLDIRSNELTVPDSIIKLNTLSSLRHLQLSSNNLANVSKMVFKNNSFSLKGLSNLETLEMEDCNLSNISSSLIDQNTELRVIKLGGNRFSRLPSAFFKKQVFLKELHLDRNLFRSVPSDSLMYLYNLASLNFSGNKISDLHESYFDNVVGLNYLDLSLNEMITISERAFHNVTALISLDISRNRLAKFSTSTFVPLVQLQTFTANDNRLKYIPVAVQGLRQIRSLYISGNPCRRLKEIQESRAVMMTVEQFVMTRTNLTTISPTDFDLFPNLKKLILSKNMLSRIAPYAFRSLKLLEHLDLSGNDIIHLSRERLFGLMSLRTLNISHNYLGSLDAFPIDLKHLIILDVSFNRLQSISRDSLKYLQGLVRLDLRGNLLTTLFPEVLRPLVSLKAIDLRKNLFNALPLEGIQSIEDSLESINLEGNPIICSCNSYGQKVWLRQHRKWLDLVRRGSKAGPQCSEPKGIQDRYLLTLKDSEMCPLPSVSSLSYTKMDPYNFLITWKSQDTNMTGLRGFIVAYHRLDKNDHVRKYRVGPTIRGFRIQTSVDDTLYLVCVVTRGSSMNSELNSADENGKGEPNDFYINQTPADDNDYVEQDLDNQFYPMPFEFNRRKRDSDIESTFDVINEDDYNEYINTPINDDPDMVQSTRTNNFFQSFISGFGSSETFNPYDALNLTEMEYLAFPSSNDTELLVNKPAVVNLGSQSSKCIQIRTPPDPSKLSLIENRRMSVVIGVSMGLIVFVFIIVAIVTIKPGHKDEPKHNDEEEVLPDPSEPSKGGTEPAAIMQQQSTPKPRAKESKSNSTTPKRQTRTRKKKNAVKSHRKKNRLNCSDNNSDSEEDEDETVVENRTTSTSKKRNNGRRNSLASKISSSESSIDEGRSRSRINNASGYDCTSTIGGATGISGREIHPGGQSWHGTPRAMPRMGPYHYQPSNYQQSFSTTLPRRNTEQNHYHHPRTKRMNRGYSGMSLDGAAAAAANASSATPHNGRNGRKNFESSTSSIPFVEYHLIDATNDPPLPSRGVFERPPPPSILSMPSQMRYNKSEVNHWNGARPKKIERRNTSDHILKQQQQPPPLPARIQHSSPIRNNHHMVDHSTDDTTTNSNNLNGIEYYRTQPSDTNPNKIDPASSTEPYALKYDSFAQY